MDFFDQLFMNIFGELFHKDADFLGRYNLAQALQNSPYQIQSCLTSFEAKGSLRDVSFPDF